MPTWKATARAFANLALQKYWGDRNSQLRLPANSSLSINLDGLYTLTTVIWDNHLPEDRLTLNGQPDSGAAQTRVSTHLGMIRQRLALNVHAQVESENNFPMGAGIASSASSFAALTLAAVTAAGVALTKRELSRLARRGSGSAARSIPPGFVEWYAADTHEGSYAESIAPPEHWNLVDVIAIISKEHKTVGSTAGHRSADTSDLQPARLNGAAERLAVCKKAVLERDFATMAEVVERDSNLMHAVMMTSRPPLFYWLPGSLRVMDQVRRWRADGLEVCYTLDAGPNVHCICARNSADQVSAGLRTLSEVLEVCQAGVGGGAEIIPTP